MGQGAAWLLLVNPHGRKDGHEGNTVHVSIWVKAMLPVKLAFHTHRLTTFQEELNNVALREALDLLPSILGDALLTETL